MVDAYNRQLKEFNETLTNECWELEMTITQLKKQAEELDFKLKESMTDKYVLKKIPSGRKPKKSNYEIKRLFKGQQHFKKGFW